MTAGKKPSRRRAVLLALWLLIILPAALVFVLIPLGSGFLGYAQLTQPYASMSPTLLRGDVFVARPVSRAEELDYGDVVVFRPRESRQVFIKRLIGLPGDRIAIAEGDLVINGLPVETEHDGYQVEALAPAAPICSDPVGDEDDPRCRVARISETLPGGRTHFILNADDDRSRLDNMPEVTVPAEHVFVMGDNRDYSNDSRSGFGYIPRENITHVASFVVRSHDPSRGFPSFRWRRFLAPID